jgi:tripartite-type tricarboxylate transporter receptor subunit TctC
MRLEWEAGMRRIYAALLGAIVCAAAMSTPAAAQDVYPSKSINLIVPFAAGGTSDVIARLAADEIGRVLSQRLVIENIGGAGGSIALARAARAEPDGYTLVIGNTGTHAASYFLQKSLQYKPDSFAPIGLIAKTSPVLAVKTGFPAKTLAEFVAYAKANPGKVSLGHAGVGSSNYLICRSFIMASGVEVNLVSYRGAAPALNDLMAGHIDGACDSATSVANAILAGKVIGLAVGSTARLPNVPDMPTSIEAGTPGFQAEGWNALFAPAGTPPAVITKLNEALRVAVYADTVKKRLLDLSSVPASGEELEADYTGKLVLREIEKYRKLLAE